MSDESNIRGDIISAVEEFDYSTQADSYNESYKNWRKNKNNPYAFNFEKNIKERVYIDGRGFMDQSLEKAESKTVTEIMKAFGNACMMYIVIDMILSQAIVWLLGQLGMDISTNFSTSTISGGSHEVAVALIAFGLLKTLIPTLYLYRKFKVPFNVAVMQSPNNPSAILGAISIALMGCVVVSVPSAYSRESKEIFAFFASSGADVSVWNQTEFIAYTVFDTVIMPIAQQLLFCGAIFAVLRQFGDRFAILITALTAALLEQDFYTMPAVFVVYLAAGYGMLASGTLFAAVAVNIVYRMYTLALTLVEMGVGSLMIINRSIFMSIVLVTGAMGTIGYLRYMNRKNIHLARYYSESTFLGRVSGAVKIFPFSAIGLICIFHALVRAVL